MVVSHFLFEKHQSLVKNEHPDLPRYGGEDTSESQVSQSVPTETKHESSRRDALSPKTPGDVSYYEEEESYVS